MAHGNLRLHSRRYQRLFLLNNQGPSRHVMQIGEQKKSGPDPQETPSQVGQGT